MSTIADYSVFTKKFLVSKDVDFSKLYGKLTVQDPDGSGGEVEALRSFAVVPMDLGTTLTTRGALNLDTSNWTYGDIKERISCRDADGKFIGNIVRVQPGVREGSIRLVAKVAVPAAVEGDVADISVNTFVLLRAYSIPKVGGAFSTNVDLPIAVATISKGYTLHRHLASGNDPLDDVENANYVSFTINNLNGYTSVDFNPDAYATYDDVANALSRGIDGLHIAFDTASGDLKLLDKDGNVLDQANLPIKADVIIAEGEEGYKYVKTDVKQDIHAAKAWMPEGKTAWEDVPKAPYEMKHAALVMGKGSTPASRVFVDMKSGYNHPISTEPVQFEHVVTDDAIYMVVDKNGTTCSLIKVKGRDEAETDISAGLSGEQVTLNDPSQSYPITNGPVEEVDVIKDKDGVTTLVLAGTKDLNTFRALSIGGKYRVLYTGRIVTFEGSSAASKVFVDQNSGYNYPVSTEPVQFDHVIIGGSTYMVTGKNETNFSLRKVKGEAGEPFITDAVISGEGVILNSQQNHTYPIIKNKSVKVDVIKDGGTTLVLAGTKGSGEFQAWSLDGNPRFFGFIVTSGGSSADKVLGITPDGTTLYTFDENAETPSEIHNISGGTVRWLDRKTLTGDTNHTLKYGLEAFVWTVKDREVKLNEPFFNQLNASLLALGFHEGDDIALGTNLATLAPAEGVSPLNKVDANEYIHGKNNKATREREVDDQRANAKKELVAWNAQHPALTKDREHGTIIDSTGLDVRNGSITLGCGRTGEEGKFQKVNYGIQMKNRSEDPNTHGRSESLDFTISHTNGKVSFDENGHATGLTSSTLLSIEAGSYISGAPTCLILAEVTHNSENEPVVFTPVRMTAGFDVGSSYDEGEGLRLTIHDYRDNIFNILNPNGNTPTAPAIIEVQAIYTHSNAQSETVPAQQMHTYIGSWEYGAQPACSFLCNKIEEWMTAVGLADAQNQVSELYVVIRVY